MFKNILYLNILGADGSSYEGFYKDGKKNAKGKYVWSDGSFYDGDWVENKITGKVLHLN